MDSPTVVGLRELLAPLPVDTFVHSYWPDRSFSTDGDPARLRALFDIPELGGGFETLVSSWPGAVSAFRARSGDESDAVAVSPATARKLWDEGYALTFLSVNQALPYLSQCLLRMVEELRLPPATGSRCIVYATPRGAGAGLHFDQNANFVVQLHGHKRWWVAENRHVQDPTVRHVAGRAPHRELHAQIQETLPEQMPPHAESLVLRPGSVLFVPRGWWHATAAETDSLSLNFTFSQRTWADVVGDAVRQRLIRLPRWRALAQGLGSSDPATARSAERRLDELLSSWVQDVGDLAPPELADSSPAPGAPVGLVNLQRGWVAIDEAKR